MKSYFIFIFILTVLYIIYYAVMIAKDLYGKKGNKNSSEEEFDVSDLEGEGSISVVENDNGFNIGENEYETNYAEEYLSDQPQNDEKPKQNVVDMLNERVKSNMEETQVTFSNTYNASEVYKLLLQKGVGFPKTKNDITVKPAIDEL